jgi:hypothetical protein
MFLQILPRRSLPVWMPEPQSGTRENRLRVRRCLQVRSRLHLQALVSGATMPRIGPLIRSNSRTWGSTRRHFETKNELNKGPVWDTESEVCSR